MLKHFIKFKINNNKSKIFYFENNSLKFEQNFKFGFDVILEIYVKLHL